MQSSILKFSIASLSLLIVIGCGSSGSDDDRSVSSDTVRKLTSQSGTQSYLFYGDVNHKVLGGIKNLRVVDADNPKKILIQNNDTSEINYPVLSTSMNYNAENGTYSDLHVDSLMYVADAKSYKVSMKKGASKPVSIQNSNDNNISKPSYTKISYLGDKNYLIGTNTQTNKNILITPDAQKSVPSVDFGDRKLLSVTYKKYGEPVDGYLVYNNLTKKVETCNLQMSCTEIMEAGSRDFEGDIGGSVYSVFLVDDKLIRVDKSNGSKDEISLDGKVIATGHGTTSFQGDSFYFIAEDENLYRVNLLEKSVIKITKEKDSRLERIRAFTNDWVIYGSDTLLMAAKKDGSTNSPVVLVETTKTRGYKYVTKYAIGDDFLFVRYSVDPKTADTKYQACIFNNTQISCKDNSFWAGATAAKSGVLNFESSYPYTPYAYVRVDNTDNFGGGTLKAIDPKNPFDDGLSLGDAPDYNFQTFLTNSRYYTQTIDSDGAVVLYAKNDRNYHVDSFYVNLLKENSLVQLTNTDPKPDVTSGRDHCHGRHCMICHNFAGGKIYTDKNGSKSAYGYRAELEFENGDKVLSDVAKGKSENFSITLKKLLSGNFKVNILDESNKVMNHSLGYNHKGVEYANCNFCHGRDEKNLRFDAPSVITIEK